MYKQKLIHVDHINYEMVVNPLLKEGWVILSVNPDGHNGAWIVLATGSPCNNPNTIATVSC